MRTTIEMPDELLVRAKIRATEARISLKEFLIEAVEEKLAVVKVKSRRPPPAIGRTGASRIRTLTREQTGEALLG